VGAGRPGAVHRGEYPGGIGGDFPEAADLRSGATGAMDSANPFFAR